MNRQLLVNAFGQVKLFTLLTNKERYGYFSKGVSVRYTKLGLKYPGPSAYIAESGDFVTHKVRMAILHSLLVSAGNDDTSLRAISGPCSA